MDRTTNDAGATPVPGENLHTPHPHPDAPRGSQRPARHALDTPSGARAGTDTPAPQGGGAEGRRAEATPIDPRYRNWLGTERDMGGGFFVRKLYVKMAGDLVAGIMLSQIAYWHSAGPDGKPRLRVQRDGHLWLVKARTDWQDELCLSAKQADRGLRVLRERGLIETMVARFGGDPTTHIRIVWPRFLDAREELLDDLAAPLPEPTLPAGEKPDIPEGNSVIPQRVRTGLTRGQEHITETTDNDYRQASSQEALAVEDSSRRSSNSLSEHQPTPDSDGRRSSQEVTTPSSAGERSGTAEKLKNEKQEPAPRAGKRESPASIATPPDALVLGATDLSAAGRETLAAALARQAELKGEANVAHTRRRLLALRGEDEQAWISLVSHATHTARTCVASFAETHAKRPADAGTSLADAEREKRRRITRGGSYAERRVFVEDGAPRDLSDPSVAAREARRHARYVRREEARQANPDDRYTQFGEIIACGTRSHPKGPSLDVRRSEKGLLYELLPGERTEDEFSDGYYHSPYDDSDIPVGLRERDAIHARMDANPERAAAARRRREGYEWLFDVLETEASA